MSRKRKQRQQEPRGLTSYERAVEAFDPRMLKRVCEMHETEFGEAFGFERVQTSAKPPEDYYYFKDNGSNVLAVAHLDTVMPHGEREANFVNTADGPVIFSGALDDRLGAYTITQWLPALGINVDVLLTVGEESCNSTASYFTPPKEYHWMIEFDRGGTDVVLYQYEDLETERLVESVGLRVGNGSYSDIADLEFLEIKGFNWGIGYRDYHGPRSHAWLRETWAMVSRFIVFHEAYADLYLPHEMERRSSWWGDWRSGRSSLVDGYECCDGCGNWFEVEEFGETECLDCRPPAVDEDEVVSEDFATVQRAISG